MPVLLWRHSRRAQKLHPIDSGYYFCVVFTCFIELWRARFGAKKPKYFWWFSAFINPATFNVGLLPRHFSNEYTSFQTRREYILVGSSKDPLLTV